MSYVRAKTIVVILFATLLTIGFQNCGQQFSPIQKTATSDNTCSNDNCAEPTVIVMSYSATSCAFNNETIPNGDSIFAYIDSTSSNCEKELRVCHDGKLSGSYQYLSCQNPDGKRACRFNNQTVSHGDSMDAFLNSSEELGTSCQAQQRTCTDGELSGSFSFASCTVGGPKSCLFKGRTIPHGGSALAFLEAMTNSGDSCQSEERLCTDGELSGDYAFDVCDAKINNEKVLDQLPLQQIIDEPSVYTKNTVLNMNSTTNIPTIDVSRGVNRWTSVFCNYNHVNMQNNIVGDRLTISKSMAAAVRISFDNFLLGSYCPDSITLGSTLQIKSTLRIKGNLTVNGPLEILPGGLLIVEGEILHVGTSSSTPGLILIHKGAVLSHTRARARIGKVNLRQHGAIYNVGDYKVGKHTDHSPQAEAIPRGLSFDIDLTRNNSDGADLSDRLVLE